MKNIGDLFQLKRGGLRNAVLPRNGVMMANQSAGKDRRALAVAIGEGVMDACRWVTGDRVTIDMDCADSSVTIRRVAPSEKGVVSWTLSSRTNEKVSGKKTGGRVVAATIKITATDMMLKAFGMEDADEPYVPEVVTTGSHGVSFKLRKPWTVVERIKK